MSITKSAKYREVTFGQIQGKATFDGTLCSALRADRESESNFIWPNPKYQKNIAGFFRDILGINPWEKQLEVFAAIESGETFIQVPSGHKTGKSNSAAGLSLWNACSFDDSRSIMTSTTDHQVNNILWREFRILHSRAGRCYACKQAEPGNPSPCEHSAVIPGTPAEVARSGWKLPGAFNEVYGFTSKEAESFAGISGPRLLFIGDEATGIKNKIFETIEGNMAGGNCVCVTYSNPTRDAGWFFDMCVRKKLGTTIEISSEDSPNVKAGKIIIPGLASLEWLDQQAQRWGRDSEWWRVRVQGKFAHVSDKIPFSLSLIDDAKIRWTDKPSGVLEPLTLGVDVAGMGDDDFVVTLRRGMWVSEQLEGFKGTDKEQAEYVANLARANRRGGERVTVVYDAEGTVGWEFSRAFRDYIHENKLSWVNARAVRSSRAATREPHKFHLISAELVDTGRRWLLAGGAIPTSYKLEEELHAWRFHMRDGDRKNGSRVTVDKDEVKETVGRSPDRADSLFLATWTWSAVLEDAPKDDIQAPRIEREPRERSAEHGDVPALRPDWGRPAGQETDTADESFRPLGPWG